MSESNFKKSIKNMASSMLYQVLTLGLGILIPRLVLVSLGSESNGLLNSVNQAITYLALLEGGIGLTITKALYGPVARQDRNEINGIMSAANDFFRHIGFMYFAGVVIISIVFPLTIKTTLSRFTVFAVVLLTALPQVINFFCQQKYRMLISVSGKGYVLTNLTSVTFVITSIVKILLLLNGFGLIAVQTLHFAIQMIQLVFIVTYIKRLYPWLDLRVPPHRNQIGQRSAVFWHQISGFIFSNTDMLILTYFCDLRVVSVYAIYSMLFSTINGIGGNVVSSVSFVMGQKFNTDFEGYKKLHNIYETCNMVINFSLFFVLYSCILPFLRLYTRGVTDIEYVDRILPICFLAVFLLQAGRGPSQKAIEFAGEFRNTQVHSILEMLINLSVSIICVQSIGIYGVLLGTIAALLVRNLLMVNFACKKVLHISPWIYIKKWTINLGIFITLNVMCSKLISGFIFDSYWILTVYAGALMIVSAASFAGMAFIYDKKSCLYLIDYLGKKLQGSRKGKRS